MRKFSFFNTFLKKDLKADKLKVESSMVPHIERDNNFPKIQLTSLKCGAKVITESIIFPTSVHIGLLFKSGIRNDFKGVLNSFQNTYFRNLSKEALLELQVIAPGLQISFDYETTTFHGFSLSQDSHQLIKILLNAVFISNAYGKNLDLMRNTSLANKEFEDFADVDKYANEIIFQYALKFPVVSDQEVTTTDLNEFIGKYHNVENLYIYAGGIYNHNEFADMVAGEIPPTAKSFSHVWEKAKFHPFSQSISAELPFILHSISFENPSLLEKSHMISKVLQYIIENSQLESLQISAKYTGFSDIGIFTIRNIGISECPLKNAEIVKEILNKVKKMTDDELGRIKKKMVLDTLIYWENTGKRAEFVAKTYALTGKSVEIRNLIREIDAVSCGDIKELIGHMVVSPIGALCIGKNVKTMRSWSEISNKLKS